MRRNQYRIFDIWEVKLLPTTSEMNIGPTMLLTKKGLSPPKRRKDRLRVVMLMNSVSF